EQRQGGVADPAGGPCPWGVRRAGGLRAHLGERLHPAGQAGLQLRHGGGVRALLRPVDRGRALGPSSGLSTSAASTTSVSSSRGSSPLRSTAESAVSAPPPPGRSVPSSA